MEIFIDIFQCHSQTLKSTDFNHLKSNIYNMFQSTGTKQCLQQEGIPDQNQYHSADPSSVVEGHLEPHTLQGRLYQNLTPDFSSF